MLTGLFEDKPVYRKFLILVFIILLSTIIFSLVGGLWVNFVYGVDMLKDPNALSDLTNPAVISAMKILQILTTGIGMFLVPSVIAAVVFSKQPAHYLSLKKGTAINTKAITVLLMFALVPVINMLHLMNQEMHLPSFLSGVETWMKKSEEQAEKITEVFLNMNNAQELFYNLFIVAVLPALGEEFLFRGILQKLFKEITNNVHVAIFITAILFSAIHMQFYGFFPRMMLGVLFGYMLEWTGSIWIPVLAHFINNGAAVVFAYLSSANQLPFNQDTVGTTEGEWPVTIVAIVLSAGLIWILKKAEAKPLAEV